MYVSSIKGMKCTLPIFICKNGKKVRRLKRQANVSILLN